MEERVASAGARATGAGDVESASTLAAHALLSESFGLTFIAGLDFSVLVWDCSAAAANCWP